MSVLPAQEVILRNQGTSLRKAAETLNLLFQIEHEFRRILGIVSRDETPNLLKILSAFLEKLTATLMGILKLSKNRTSASYASRRNVRLTFSQKSCQIESAQMFLVSLGI